MVSEAIFPTNRGHTFVLKSVRRFSFRAPEVPDLRERKGHFYIQQLWGGRRKHSSGWFGTPLRSPMSCKKVTHSFCLTAGGVKSRAAQSDIIYSTFLQYYSTQYFSIVKSVSGPMVSTPIFWLRFKIKSHRSTKGVGPRGIVWKSVKNCMDRKLKGRNTGWSNKTVTSIFSDGPKLFK